MAMAGLGWDEVSPGGLWISGGVSLHPGEILFVLSRRSFRPFLKLPDPVHIKDCCDGVFTTPQVALRRPKKVCLLHSDG